MIRNGFAKLKTSAKDKIKWRSHEPKRIEAFSDGAFAFAISLIIFSLDVPKNSHELLKSMKGTLPFLGCFVLVFRIWYEQYRFFRRYGMNDIVTIFLNGFLIFLVLVYVYPLKFLWSTVFLIEGYMISEADVVPVMFLFLGGAGGLAALFTGMYFNAYLKRDELKLLPHEIFETKTYLFGYLSATLTGTVTAILFGIVKHDYMVYCVGMLYAGIIGTFIFAKVRKKMFRKKFANLPMIEPHLGAE